MIPKLPTRLIQQISIVFWVALTLACLDLIKDSHFEFIQVNEFMYSIYLLSGIRLLVIILFGWLGALGLFIGYFSSGILFREFAVEIALGLGLISALTPLLAFSLWKRLTGFSNNFKNVSFSSIIALVFLYSGLLVAVRGAYFTINDIPVNAAFIWTDFLSKAVGALLFLYLLKLVNWSFKSIKGHF
jgi:hypothetical protein